MVVSSRLRQKRRRVAPAAGVSHGPALRAIAAWHQRFDPREALTRDPLRFVRRYPSRTDRELVALLAALMAFGRVAIISAKLEVLLALLGPSPAAWATEHTMDSLVARLQPFRHRTFRGDDIARLVWAAGALIREDGGLYVSLERAHAAHGDLRTALATWTDTLRGMAWPGGMTRSARHLLPDPRGPSASKRLLLLCRWIARPDHGVDVGLARIPTASLVIPVDVHVHRIARNLGLTTRRDASWVTAEEITATLRTLSPDDPVQYDMAICHLGISGRCPSRQDPVRCEGCTLQPVCIHWQRPARAPRRTR